MRSVQQPAYIQRNGEFDTDEYSHRPKGGKIHLLIAILGMGSLGYMLWSIAQMLEVIPG